MYKVWGSKEEIAEMLYDLGSDDVERFGGRYTGGIHLQQWVPECSEFLWYLYSTVSLSEHLNILEIGSASGAMCRVFGEVFGKDKTTFTIVDNNEHPMHTLRPENLKGLDYEEFIGCSHSPECEQYLVERVNKKDCFDIVFIDADHRYKPALDDWHLAMRLSNLGMFVPYIAFHDIYYEVDGVGKLFEELKVEYKDLHFVEFGDKNEKCSCGIGLAY